MPRIRSSRRAPGLKPGDYDHEIVIVDHEDSTVPTSTENNVSRMASDEPLLSTKNRGTDSIGDVEDHHPTQANHANDERYTDSSSSKRPEPSSAIDEDERRSGSQERASMDNQVPTPDAFCYVPDHLPTKPHVERETAIDVLYENERGGFFCGAALFSGAALGGLDPTPWTNTYHKTSPTSIHTAQVPDPSWEWVWPEWHLNHQKGTDEGGWEYAFAFGKKFSWHKPRWFNSFVRRRAWTRMRAKKLEVKDQDSINVQASNSDYFTIQSTSDMGGRGRSHSLASSRGFQKTGHASMEVDEPKPRIEDLETLLSILRHARIDREKLEATENYLDNAVDLSQLQDEMHEIMTLFVFQASRRLLLSRLMTVYEDTCKAVKNSKENEALRERKNSLQLALEHADEEVRRLAYWSDVKQMAEKGESKGAASDDKGWQDEWQGIDQSGPVPPNKGQLPGPKGLDKECSMLIR